MKKITLFVLFVMFTGMTFAQDFPITLDVAGALTIETGDSATGDDSDSDLFAGIFNIFKAGAYADVIYTFNDFVGAGVELGFYTMPNEDGDATALIDLPVLAIVEGSLFDIVRVKGHFGYTLSSHLTSDGLEYVNKLSVGARAYLGLLYLDYAALSWDGSKTSTKWGLGVEMPIL